MKKQPLEEKIAALAAWAIEETATHGIQLPKKPVDITTLPKFRQFIHIITNCKSGLNMSQLAEKEKEVKSWCVDSRVWAIYKKHGCKLGNLYFLLSYFEAIGITPQTRQATEEQVFALSTEGVESFAT